MRSSYLPSTLMDVGSFRIQFSSQTIKRPRNLLADPPDRCISREPDQDLGQIAYTSETIDLRSERLPHRLVFLLCDVSGRFALGCLLLSERRGG